MAQPQRPVASWLHHVCVTEKYIDRSGSNKDYSEQKLYLSTHTSEGEQNYLMQATVQMPLPDTVIDMRKYDSDGNSSCY